MKVGTLFSGIGAPEFALKSLGVDVSLEFACDCDTHAKKTYLKNHQCKVFYDDITKLDRIPDVDLLIFGFPCQPFSLAGKGNGLNDIRGKLVLKALDLIKNNPPKKFIAENVEGLVYQDNGKTLKILLKKMKQMGYNVTHKVLNSLDYGVPQNRKRIWIVGTLEGQYQFPESNIVCPPLAAVLDKRVDKTLYATSDFLAKPKVIQRMRNYENNYVNCITQTICRNGSSSEYISYVAAVNKAIGQARKPSVEECCRLFGFPPDFSFPNDVCRTRRYAMLANSMVVPVLKSVIGGLI